MHVTRKSKVNAPCSVMISIVKRNNLTIIITFECKNAQNPKLCHFERRLLFTNKLIDLTQASKRFIFIWNMFVDDLSLFVSR